MNFEELINTIDIYHQKKIINYLKKLKIEVIVDVGAHKGEFLSYCLQLNKEFKIHCFEPQENIFQELQSKFSKNQFIKLNKLALDNIIKQKFLYVSKLSSTSTLKEIDKNKFFFKFKQLLLKQKNTYIEKYLVRTSTLDKYVDENKIDHISLLKIDTEGNEINVLEGAKNILDRTDYIIIENHFFSQYKNQNRDREKIDKLLKKHQFKRIKKFIFPLPYFSDDLYKSGK